MLNETPRKRSLDKKVRQWWNADSHEKVKEKKRTRNRHINRLNELNTPSDTLLDVWKREKKSRVIREKRTMLAEEWWM